ncbi:MAG: ABC transporter ATP-binding protein, partial [Defluviitaleaceae bacterium]|nr:ABC transporter ATP-binding protein [Defluviitaleaceae bacterium]
MLKLENVIYRYKGSTTDVLKSVCAEMPAGKLSAIVGPSGSGKTTLLSIMAGMDKPTSGAVYVDDVDIATLNMDTYRRERIAMIFQAFQLFPLLTALENVCFSMEVQGVSRADAKNRAAPLLRSVGISDDKHGRYPANLSGG